MTHWAQSIINNTLNERQDTPGQTFVARGNMRVETRRMHNLQEVAQCMRNLRGRGWCALVDKLCPLSDSEWPDEHVLMAEKVDGRTSYHLRWDGQAWLLATISREDSGQHWIFTHKLARIGGGSLTYEVAWKPDEQGILRPHVSRLVDVHDIQTEEEPV